MFKSRPGISSPLSRLQQISSTLLTPKISSSIPPVVNPERVVTKQGKMAFFQGLPWHEGEEKIHAMTKVPHSDNPTSPVLPYSLAMRVGASPTIALGAIDAQDRVWCTLWGGGPGPIAQQVAKGVIGIRTHVDASFDPVVQILYGGMTDGEIIKFDPKKGKLMSGLSINLEERDRVKLGGRMIAGSLDVQKSQAQSTSTAGTEIEPKETRKGQTGEAQLCLHVTQSLGNCPKYINKRIIKSHHESIPVLASESPVLTPEAIDHIRNADVFFVASRGPGDMDCNHRGGAPGFVRVQPQDSTSTVSVLTWPEYSGNNLYQTLGNIISNPAIGLVIPNLVTGNVLYVSGNAEILIDAAATSVIQKTKLAVQLTITAARFVLNGLTFRGIPATNNKDVSSSNPNMSRSITDGMSPYNPRIRYLTSELTTKSGIDTGLPPDEYRGRNTADVSATLIKKTKLTPTINKYRFRLSSSDGSKSALWKPGQYIALDFSDELYMGYSHMRDDNPEALNDDFIRTFTVATPFEVGKKDIEFEIVLREVGTATRWLSHQNDRSGITHLGILGFDGEFRFTPPAQPGKKNVFIAAGIGITPLLGQLDFKDEGEAKALTDDLILVFTVHIKDIGLLIDVLASCPPQLKQNSRIFVTGTDALSKNDANLQKLVKLEETCKKLQNNENEAMTIERRRLTKADLLGLEAKGDIEVEKWYFCTGPAMQKNLLEWLDGRSVVFEKFDY